MRDATKFSEIPEKGVAIQKLRGYNTLSRTDVPDSHLRGQWQVAGDVEPEYRQ